MSRLLKLETSTTILHPMGETVSAVGKVAFRTHLVHTDLTISAHLKTVFRRSSISGANAGPDYHRGRKMILAHGFRSCRFLLSLLEKLTSILAIVKWFRP
ncbi:hypothetical protein KIN20_016076 [Parelaphostrongylus tenuis]|uniref:Uncharacterized protein n=1 Tax=Parelaphostrongylus tenuis TaxID=148309 RepID=A0AAD5N1J5_PARTN|nr:hypothetical protein KIN20_016076 [Parelaphostrongylus tenuis]